MTERLTIIYRAPTSMQAHLLTHLLAERDIPSRVVGDSMINVESMDSPVSVLVPVQHAKVARFIANSFDRHILRSPASDEGELTDPDDWEAWPACPGCGTLRTTWCPYCGTLGSDFALADIPPGAVAEGPLLICGTCDEPFCPSFFRACEQCGHRFTDGQEVQPLSNETRHDIWRSTLGALLFLAVFAAVAWWILRS